MDRETAERLTALEVGQKHTNSLLKDGFLELHKKFDAMPCADNSGKVKELYTDYTDRQMRRKTMVRSLLSGGAGQIATWLGLLVIGIYSFIKGA